MRLFSQRGTNSTGSHRGTSRRSPSTSPHRPTCQCGFEFAPGRSVGKRFISDRPGSLSPGEKPIARPACLHPLALLLSPTLTSAPHPPPYCCVYPRALVVQALPIANMNLYCAAEGTEWALRTTGTVRAHLPLYQRASSHARHSRCTRSSRRRTASHTALLHIATPQSSFIGCLMAAPLLKLPDLHLPRPLD